MAVHICVSSLISPVSNELLTNLGRLTPPNYQPFNHLLLGKSILCTNECHNFVFNWCNQSSINEIFYILYIETCCIQQSRIYIFRCVLRTKFCLWFRIIRKVLRSLCVLSVNASILLTFINLSHCALSPS